MQFLLTTIKFQAHFHLTSIIRYFNLCMTITQKPLYRQSYKNRIKSSHNQHNSSITSHNFEHIAYQSTFPSHITFHNPTFTHIPGTHPCIHITHPRILGVRQIFSSFIVIHFICQSLDNMKGITKQLSQALLIRA